MTYLDDPQLEALLILSLLFVKHFLCDFVLQTAYQARTKGSYGHIGGLLHASIHAVGTGLVLLLFRVDADTLIAVVLAELIIHYHVDFFKERITRARQWRPTQHAFWIALGADQLIHAQTYVAIVLWIATRPV